MRYGFHPEKVAVSEPQPAVFQSGALLFYVSSGGGTLWVNGQELPLTRGSFGWLHSYHIFRFEPGWEETLELFRCPFDYAAASYASYRDSLMITRSVMTDCSPVVQLSGNDAAYMEELMEEFIAEGSGGEAADIVEGCALFLEITTCFLRFSARQAETDGNQPFERNLAWKLLQHIFTYSNENLTREKLADIYGVTGREVSCQLNLTAGMGFPRLLNRARIDRACDMMYYGGLTMNYIARYVGYHSETAFYRAFKDVMGMTPQEYQKKVILGERGEAEPIDVPALAILHHLLSHYREPLTVTETAKALFLEKNSINETLKKNFGMEHAVILKELRMACAETLLKNSHMPAADVALACGYSCSHTFNRIFSHDHGMTPGEYRRIYGKAELPPEKK